MTMIKSAKTKRRPATSPNAPAKTVAPVAEKPRNLLPHEVLTSTNLQNAVGVLSWGKFAGDADLGELVKDLREEVKKVVQDGNMQPAETMLYGQAMTLQTIFTNLARRAANNDGLKQFQVNLSLALKAQAQCRSTLEALALIKSPMPYIRQANIANGHQQVNNGTTQAAGTHQNLHSAQTRTRAGENNFAPNKLLEADHGQPGIGMDTRATETAARSDPAVEAVGAVHRAEKRQG